MSNVTFLGLGTMGAPMAGHLARAGHTVRGWNRTPGRPSIEGVLQVASLKEALSGADAVVLSVSDTPDVEELLLGVDGAISALAAGAVVIDTSTIAPSATRRMGEQLATKGILMVDAPVSGGSEGAVNGTLTVFLGGSAEAVAAAQPYLAAFAKTITHLGPLGAGQVGKAVNQLVISGSYLSLAEGILVGQAAPPSPGSLRTAGSAWPRIAIPSASRWRCIVRTSASPSTLPTSSASPSPRQRS
jgi:3-hydroxyisobutyrate dehydrogenase